MKILAVIPARGGSKSVPRKNIATLAGMPLLAFTVSEALRVDEITDLIVSTDDAEIADLARSMGIKVPFIRPPELATDDALTAPVLRHAILQMEALSEARYDAVLLLQPTSPLRRACHIKTAIDMFRETNCDSIVSVVSVMGNHPFRMKRLVGDRLVNFIEQGFEDMRPRQKLPPVYIRNGAIYLSRRYVIVDQQQVVGPVCLGFEMSPEDSINIDDAIDLKLAELILKARPS